jgi:hypothetical protein
MIYNLSKYISNNSSIVPSTNGFDEEYPELQVAIIERGGSETPIIGTGNYSVQVISRDKSRLTSKQLIQVVYNLLSNRFNLDLPEVTVDGTLYPALTLAGSVSRQLPGYIGTDEEGRHRWSTNFAITTEEVV